MDLSDRKRKILQAIIDEYIGTAEPVGSRAISKKNELGLSSATIRNEMADLEEMGYLLQPHTSAGRIPSDMGYRFYVNSLMQRYQMGVEAVERLQQAFEEKVNHLEMLVRKAGLITAALTDYTIVTSAPEMNESKIKKIDLVNLGNSSVLLVVITKTGVLRNQFMTLELDDDTAQRLTHILNEKLVGLSANEITFEKIQEIQSEIQGALELHPRVLIAILNFVYQTIESLDETEIYVDNAKSILKYPEYSDVKKAREMLNFLEDKNSLKSLISGHEIDRDVHVKIGSENQFQQLHDSSLITVNYSMGDKMVGKIGVIGPKRMNYAKVIASLDCIASYIDKILYELYTPE